MRKNCFRKRRRLRRFTASNWSSPLSKRSSFGRWEGKPMRNMLLIARREYLEQVRGRAFRMTTLGLPAVFALVLGVGYLSSLGLGANRHMAVVASNLALANEVRDQLVGDKEAKARIDVITQSTAQERDALVRKVQTEQLDGVVWVEAGPGKIPSGSYISASSG